MPFKIVDTLTVGVDIRGVRSATIDISRDSAYFGCLRLVSGGWARILRIKLSSFTEDGWVLLPGETDAPWIALADPGDGYAYFGTPITKQLYKIDLDTFVIDDVLDLSGVLPGRIWGAAVIDPVGGFIYIGNYMVSPGSIVKVNLHPLAVDNVLVLADVEEMECAVADTASGLAYFGGRDDWLAKVEISPGFAQTGSLELDGGFGWLQGAVIDPAEALAYFYSDGFVYRVDLLGFVVTGSLDIGIGPCYENVLDPAEGYAYFGSWASPAKIAVVRLSDFVLEDMLDSPVSGLHAAVIDTGARRAYFGGSGRTIVRLGYRFPQTLFLLA